MNEIIFAIIVFSCLSLIILWEIVKWLKVWIPIKRQERKLDRAEINQIINKLNRT